MNIFEKLEQTATEIGKKTQDFASDTKVKADNAIQISKLNSKIGDYKRSNDVFYRQLGEHYYSYATTKTGEDALEPLIEKIKNNLVEIENLNNQIAEIKASEKVETSTTETENKGRTCSKCGAKVADDALFCTKCGNKLEEVK